MLTSLLMGFIKLLKPGFFFGTGTAFASVSSLLSGQSPCPSEIPKLISPEKIRDSSEARGIL